MVIAIWNNFWLRTHFPRCWFSAFLNTWLNLKENSIAIHSCSYWLQTVSSLVHLVQCIVSYNGVKGVTLSRHRLEQIRVTAAVIFFLLSFVVESVQAFQLQRTWLICLKSCLSLKISLDLIDSTVFEIKQHFVFRFKVTFLLSGYP